MLQLKPKSEKNLISTLIGCIYGKWNCPIQVTNDYTIIYHITVNSYNIKWDLIGDTALEMSLEPGEWKYFFPRTVHILKFPPSLIPLTIHLSSQNQHP